MDVQTPPDAAEQVAAFPRRTAHAVFALLEAQRQDGYGPFKASEIVTYDSEAISAVATGRALFHGLKLGLTDRWGVGLWSPTIHATLLREALEERFLEDTTELVECDCCGKQVDLAEADRNLGAPWCRECSSKLGGAI